MAKRYRTIRLTYNTTTDSIDVPTNIEQVEYNDLETIRQAIDGTRYSFITGMKRVFSYSYSYSNAEVYNFFANGYNAFNDDFDVSLERENDDGTFESIPVIIRRPQRQDETVGSTDKIYADVNVELLEI